MQVDMKDTGTVAVLTLPPNLTSHFAETLKMYLRHSLGRTGRLIVDCEQVTTVDSDCLKILCAAYRLSRTMHKDIVVAGQQPELFLKAVEFAHCRVCGQEGEGCLWEMR